MQFTIQVNVKERVERHLAWHRETSVRDQHCVSMAVITAVVDTLQSAAQQLNSIKSPLGFVFAFPHLHAWNKQEFINALSPAHWRVARLFLNLTKEEKGSNELLTLNAPPNLLPAIVEETGSTTIVEQIKVLLIMAWENLLPESVYIDEEYEEFLRKEAARLANETAQEEADFNIACLIQAAPINRKLIAILRGTSDPEVFANLCKQGNGVPWAWQWLANNQRYITKIIY